jgi:hypothetical protein
MTTINSVRILVIALLFTVGAISLPLACTSRHPKTGAKPKLPAAEYRVDDSPGSVNNDPEHYDLLLTKVESERVILARRYQQASSEAERVRIVAQARDAVIRSIYTEIFPSWYGTSWDFNGTTEVPRQGKIACGYFVSTVLRDAGWRVQRARLAQQASENIILSLTAEPYIKRFRRIPIGDFVNSVKEWGPGIYVVGLDIHTGFIVNNGDEVYFVHSSYVDPFMVVKETALDSKILQTSAYRVLGKITADDELIKGWLLKKEIVTREPS